MSLFEQKKDYSGELQILEESLAVVSEEGLEDAVTALFALEKKCRLGSDMTTHKHVCVRIVQICKLKNNWARLNASLVLINKRNIQGKESLTAVVKESMTYIEQTPNIETKLELLNTLKDICDGKMYVERESAQLHFTLSEIYESQGDIAKACDTIQDVHVETYGSLTKLEKAKYILDQIRLNLLRKDYIRAAIHSSKMNRKTLEEPGFEAIKVHFYTMQIEYFMVEKNAWEICQAYYKIAELLMPAAPKAVVKGVVKKEHGQKDDKMVVEEAKVEVPPTAAELGVKPDVMESAIIFLLLSKFDNHQSDMLHRVKKLVTSTEFQSRVTLHEAYSYVLTLFTTHEIIPPRFPGQDILEAHPSLTKIAAFETDTRAYFQQQLKDRVVEHNLRVIAKYYKRIHSARLGEIMSVSVDLLEVYLSDISARGDLAVKIDRPAGIITFGDVRAPEAILSDWASDMSKMMQLMEGTCHLINRENMVYKV